VGRTFSEGVEDRVLRRIFNLEGGGQVTGSLMKICTEEFHALHIVPHCTRMRISFTGHVACVGELGKAYKVVVGRSEQKILPGHTWGRCEVKIETKLSYLGWSLWTGLICLRIGNSAISLCHQQ
jgi:hypothetical protein